MRSTPHPDYNRAAATEQWDGDPEPMFDQLRGDSYAARGKWVGRVLRDGTIIRMRVDDTDDWRRVLQLAHRTPDSGWPEQRAVLLRAAVRGSVSGFDDGKEKHLEGGGVVSIYRELFYGEVRPGLGVCPCGAPVPFNPRVKAICPDCKRRDRQRGTA